MLADSVAVMFRTVSSGARNASANAPAVCVDAPGVVDDETADEVLSFTGKVICVFEERFDD